MQPLIVNGYLLKIQLVEISEINADQKFSWAPVSHSCNPSYLGGLELEDYDYRPVGVNYS
jgi:hypothetical protein